MRPARQIHQAEDEWIFWDVEDPEKAIVILLDHEKFPGLVIELADPAATISAIESAGGDGKTGVGTGDRVNVTDWAAVKQRIISTSIISGGS